MVLHMFQILSPISELTHKKGYIFFKPPEQWNRTKHTAPASMSVFLQDKILAKMHFF